MTERDESELTAAEYALGTLTANERAAFERKLQADPSLGEALARWHERLQPLADATAPVEPPRELLAAIEAQLGGSSRVLRRRFIPTWQKVFWWCTGAFAVGVTAGSLAAFVFFGSEPDSPTAIDSSPPFYIAAVDTADHQPAFLVVVDVATAKVTVMPVKAVAPPDGDLQLWHHVTADAPAESLGLLSVDESAEFSQAVERPGLIAVSLEPTGGSPTGAPTGPVLYTGRLMPRR